MELTVSDENLLFFKQIWKILGIESILKSDLIYTISYKLNLPYKPTTMVKKIREAVSQGILIEKDQKLHLNKDSVIELNREQRDYHNKQKDDRNKFWMRIEDSIDPWMNIIEEKEISNDKKSLSLNSIIRKIMTDDAIKQGTSIPASKFHPKIENESVIGTIDDGKEDIKFLIDAKHKIIIHNCKDFRSTLPEKYLCKHFYRILMYIKKKDILFTKNLLLSLLTNKEEWQFKDS